MRISFIDNERLINQLQQQVEKQLKQWQPIENTYETRKIKLQHVGHIHFSCYVEGERKDSKQCRSIPSLATRVHHTGHCYRSSLILLLDHLVLAAACNRTAQGAGSG